jgi:hypothetical protein
MIGLDLTVEQARTVLGILNDYPRYKQNVLELSQELIPIAIAVSAYIKRMEEAKPEVKE